MLSSLIQICVPTETAGELQTDPFTLMEEREDKEEPVVREKQEDEVKKKEQQNVQTSMAEKENGVMLHPEMEENRKEKGLEVGEIKKETEMDAEEKVELCQSVPGLQTSFIQGTDLFGYVGIEAVLEQMKRKTMKAGFEFNIMVVGKFSSIQINSVQFRNTY